MTKLPKSFVALKTEAAAKKLPKSYTADLFVHDLKTLREQPESLPFVWVLHTCGTHLYTQALASDPHEVPGRPASYRGNIERALKFFAAQPDYLFYWWEGETLSPCTAQEAINRALEIPVDYWECDCSNCRRLKYEARQKETNASPV